MAGGRRVRQAKARSQGPAICLIFLVANRGI
jgi:hypothetical protein